MEITKGLVGFLVEGNLDKMPQEVVYRGKELVLNIIGTTLVGSVHRPSDVVIDYVRQLGGNPQATVLGKKNFKTSAASAALANAVSAHALEYDDNTFDVMIGHPSCSIVPALLALGEELGSSGRDILEAYILGFETGIKLAKGFQVEVKKGFLNSAYLKGWHTTGTLGMIMSAAACAKLAKLSSEKTAKTFGIVGSMAGAVRANMHTETNPLHTGNAAMWGVLAASLAKRGVDSTSTMFDDIYGYCDVRVGNENIQKKAVEVALESDTYSMLNPGMGVKYYPTATAQHAAMENTMDIVKKHDIKPDQVESIECGTTNVGPDIGRIKEPKTAREGQYSMPYCIAISVVDREIGIKQFYDERVFDPVVRSLMAKVKTYVHPDLMTLDAHYVGENYITIRLKDGSEFKGHTVRNKGYTEAGGKIIGTHPHEELLDKFRECAGYVLPKDKIERSIELVDRLEAVPHIGELIELLLV